jgi:DNA-binding NarL/FixJ family response regulator
MRAQKTHQPCHTQYLSDYIGAHPRFNILSPKEKEVLLLLAMGFSTKLVARELKVSTRTIETHIDRLKQKLQAYSKAQLIMMCFRDEAAA